MRYLSSGWIVPTSQILLALSFFAISFSLSEQAARWPQIVSVFLILVCVLSIMLTKYVPIPAQKDAQEAEADRNGVRTILLTIGLAIISLLVGLLPAVLVFTTAHLIWVGGRNAASAFMIGCAICLIFYVFFEQLLGLSLYRGMLWSS